MSDAAESLARANRSGDAPRTSRYRWRFHPERGAVLAEITRDSKIPPLLARLLVNRGVSSAEEAHHFLSPSLEGLADPFQLPGMSEAVERLLIAIRVREPIVVYGDSDVDGVCGTALLARFLAQVGANVSTYIPNRLAEGYSLSDRGVEEIERRGAKVVLTVDNGTTAVEKVERLRSRGVDVIICDHHEPGEILPPALAILNPKLKDSAYPFRYLCGTGVAYQLLSGLASRIPARGSAHDAFYDLGKNSIAFVALATICDCVPLVGENRLLARAGILAMKSSEHAGLAALRSIAGVGREIQAEDLSFRLGPRINAAGRLGQAERALALLLADDAVTASSIARELDTRNGERQILEAEIFETARAQAIEFVSRGDPLLVLAHERWHSGVVGIVAARVAQEFDRPAILVAIDPAKGRGRGSGRSARRFDLLRALTACSSHLIGFGGHAFAAGLEIESDQIEPLRLSLAEYFATHPFEHDEREILLDAELPLGVLTPSLMSEINRLAPFGEGLASPMFSTPALEVAGPTKRVGRAQNHLSFSVMQGGVRKRAIAYGFGERAAAIEGRKISLAFTPRLSLFRGTADVELEVKDIQIG